MKTIALPHSEKHKLFSKHQEGARKDVDHTFEVLQSWFIIVRRPARLWKRKGVGRIMLAYVVSQPASSAFLSHQISTRHLPPVSQQYFSLTTNQHQPSATSQPNKVTRTS
jgi:hypothetical protein